MMDIYQLTAKGEVLSHNMYAPKTPGWKVLFFVAKRGQATKEQILSYVPEATGHLLYNLRRKGVIMLVGQRVNVNG